MKLQVKDGKDRDAVAVILVRNGYTVRQTREKPAGAKVWAYYIEIVEDKADEAHSV